MRETKIQELGLYKKYTIGDKTIGKICKIDELQGRERDNVPVRIL